MESGANPLAGLLGFWMLVKLVSLLGVVAGGLYALYCLSRVAAASERTASALEEIAGQNPRAAVLPGSGLPGSGELSGTSIYAPSHSQARPFAPPMPSSTPAPMGSPQGNADV